MANVIKTVMTYPLNGQVDFSITFEYLARKFVRITLIGKDRKVLTLNSDYRFSTKTQITTNRVWGAADGYEYIEIRRFTSATERLVDFADGSILRAYDLNIAQIQAIHIAEEARDLTADTIGVNNEGDLDARGRRIINVADAKSDFDAVNLHTVKTWNESALNSANRARDEADRSRNEANKAEMEAKKASSSSDLAKVYSESALNSSNNAEKSANKAAISEINAQSSMQSARNSERTATNAKNAATDRANDAAKSADRARDEADRAAKESSKLGNWNALAEAIQEVKPSEPNSSGEVHWRYNLVSKAIDIGSKLNVGWRNTDKTFNPYLEFHHNQNIWCGSFVTTPEGYLNYYGNNLNFQCNVTLGDSYPRSINTANGIYNNGGDIQNRAGSYYISNKQVYLNDTTNHVPSTCMHWKVNDDQQSAYTFLECGGRSNTAYSIFVKDATKGQDAGYSFSTELFYSSKNIRVDWGGRHANYQENGDITTVNGLWEGGALSNHLNSLNNRVIIDIQLGGRQSIDVNYRQTNIDLGNGRVMTGVQWVRSADPVRWAPQRVHFREVVAVKGDGSWYIIRSQ